MIKAVIFDAEGVIIDTHPLWIKGDLEFISKKSPGKNRPEIYESNIVAKIVGRSVVDGARIMQEVLGFPGDPEELAKERIEIMDKLFRGNIEFIPGFEEFFNTKIKGKFKTAVGTAIRKEFLNLVEEKLPIKNFFGDNIFHISEVGNVSKPSPDIFLHAAMKLGTKPEDCVVFEDAPNGIEAAKRAGMKAIGITTTFKADLLKDADLIVNNFTEIDLSKF
jgi:beta-phosphoglucomutase-like phosphatase (HAD superfamily)